jgi:transcription initiation factor IIE alpha subunit
VPVKAGFNTYFVQAETCKDYSTEKKANPDKKKNKELTQTQKEAVALVKNLSQKGQTLTYYCCHCGAPLKIGARAPEIQKTCPRCKGDLEIIDLSKFIKQHHS